MSSILKVKDQNGNIKEILALEGKSAYQYAKEGGYTGTEAEFAQLLASGGSNQNTFSNITVGSTTITADTTADTLTLVAGNNVTITPDATNDKITIAATDTVYTHPGYTAKSSGLYKVTVDATGHVSSTTAVAKSDITALGIPAQDTTYTHPSYTAKSSGLYKVTVDATGHISAATAVTKSDITGLGIPAQDTTYGNASTSAAGIVKLNSATNSTSTTEAATPSAVKAAYDLANTANTTASGKADSDHKHSASDITSGTLPVARGGTGVTSLSALATAIGASTIATGTYTGTGTHGSANPTSITLSFAPKLLILLVTDYTTNKKSGFAVIAPDGNIWFHTTVGTQPTDVTHGSGVYTTTFSGTTVKWYCTGYNSRTNTSGQNNSWIQFNGSGITYRYIAFG